MTDGQSHIVGTWTLNLCFSKGPVSSSLQVILHLSVIPPPPLIFSLLSYSFPFFSAPLRPLFSSIYLSPPRHRDLLLSAPLWYFHLRLTLPSFTLFLSFFYVHSFKAPSFVFPPHSQIFHSLRPSLHPLSSSHPVHWCVPSFMDIPPFSIHLSARWFMPALGGHMF